MLVLYYCHDEEYLGDMQKRRRRRRRCLIDPFFFSVGRVFSSLWRPLAFMLGCIPLAFITQVWLYQSKQDQPKLLALQMPDVTSWSGKHIRVCRPTFFDNLFVVDYIAGTLDFGVSIHRATGD